MTKVKAQVGPPEHTREESIQFGPLSVIGNGSFCVVFKTQLVDNSGKAQVRHRSLQAQQSAPPQAPLHVNRQPPTPRHVDLWCMCRWP
jgi:hypothetical protein